MDLAAPARPALPALRLGLAFSILFCLSLKADTVVLLNGRALEGRVVEDGETVTIYLDAGSVKLERSRIKAIVKKQTPMDDWFARKTALAARVETEKLDGPAQGRLWFELAEWCAKAQLAHARQEALAAALAADPNQPQARLALGYVLLGSEWMTLERRNKELGLVLFHGQWVTPEAIRDAERAEDEAHRQDLELAQLEADVRLKEAQVRKTEAESEVLANQARTAAAERERLDREWSALQRERERLDATRYFVPVYSGGENGIVLEPPCPPQAPICPPQTPPPIHKPPVPPHESDGTLVPAVKPLTPSVPNPALTPSVHP